jgi:hypothetical protein
VTSPRLRLNEPPALALAGSGIAAVVLWAGPPGNDLAAHLYQRDLLLHHGFALWDNFWYAGRYDFVTYSLAYYPLAVLLGIRLLAVVTAGVAVLGFALVVEREWGSDARWSSRAFAVVWPFVVLSAAFPFLLGAALAVFALHALQSRRRRLFAVLALLTLAASPLAFLFLAVVLAGLGLARSRRTTQIALPVGIVLVGVLLELFLRRLFPDRGRFPFSPEELLGACAFCFAGLVLTWRVESALSLRFVLGAYLALCLATYAVPSALGENVLRLRFAALPLAALILSLRRWRPLPIALTAFLLACSWNLTPLAFSLVRGATDSSATRAYWTPAIGFLRRNLTPAYRAEVVDTAGHWGAFYLANADLPIARGWFRQDDFPQNSLLYTRLTPSCYIGWLRRLGVRYVVLTDAPLDYSAQREAAVIRSGHTGLKPVFRGRHMTIYALPDPTPILTGPGSPAVLEVTRSGARLAFRRAGSYRLAMRYSPYWKAASLCVSETAGGMTRLLVPRPGLVDLDFQFTASRAVSVLAGRGSACPQLAQDARVAERVTTGLRPDTKAVRAGPDRDLGEQPAASGGDRIDDAAVAASEPEGLAIGRDAAHVRAAAAGNPPLPKHLAGAETDHGDRAFAAVGRVQQLGVAARIEAVNSGAGAKESDCFQAGAVDLPEPVGVHVGDIEDLSVG